MIQIRRSTVGASSYRRNLNGALCFLSVLIFASCSLVPAPEFTLYQAAYNNAEEATDSVLDVYGRYERRVQPVSEGTFDPDQAALIAPGAEPPLTGLYRQGFAAVSDYNAMLARYAAGESISALNKEFEALGLSLDRLKSALGSLSIPGKPAVEAAQKLAGLALARSDAEEFRRSVKENGPTIRNFLKIVRSDTSSMFSDAKIAVVKGGSTPAGAQKAASDLAGFREMLAGWVLLIDETIVNLKALESAVDRGLSRGTNIAVLAASTDRMALYAENIKVAKRQLENAF